MFIATERIRTCKQYVVTTLNSAKWREKNNTCFVVLSSLIPYSLGISQRSSRKYPLKWNLAFVRSESEGRSKSDGSATRRQPTFARLQTARHTQAPARRCIQWVSLRKTVIEAGCRRRNWESLLLIMTTMAMSSSGTPCCRNGTSSASRYISSLWWLRDFMWVLAFFFTPAAALLCKTVFFRFLGNWGRYCSY